MRSFERGSYNAKKVYMEKILKQFKLKKKDRRFTEISLV